MSGDRWQRVEEIFHRAAEIAPQARSEFLARECDADESLRKELQSLLDFEGGTGETFAGAAGGKAPLTIGHYRISGKLGEGGMGVVYRATDSKLGRDVAIKVLPRFFAADEDRMARFTREAKVLAALNHSNIAQIYHFEDRALVMEFVPGETLQKALPLKTSLSYAKQIAEALEAAHEKGIVHRDLKPTNIMVTPEGVVKLLDFGLAAVSQSVINSDPTKSPIETREATKAGTIMGTAAYMSPEQAAGKAVDKRADIWSFGVVLWEMLTDRRLFEGETVSEVLASVLRSPIEFDKLPPETPTAIRGLLGRCLDRDGTKRLRDIGEARIALERALAGDETADQSRTLRGNIRRQWVAWSLAAVLTVGFFSLGVLHFSERPADSAVQLRFQIPPPKETAVRALLNVSPDGRKLAFIAGGRLWVHSLESGESRDLSEATGTPFWSRDSRFIGYSVAGSTSLNGQLKIIDPAGGPPRTVTDYSGLWGGGTWNRDGVVVFSTRSATFRVPAVGGVPVQITAVDSARQETIHYSPSFLPDGRHFLYTKRSRDDMKSAVYIGSVDAKPEQQSSVPLVSSWWGSRYAPSANAAIGYVLFVREETLMAQPFDNRQLKLIGQAVPIAEQVSDGRAFSASENGVLVFHREAEKQLIWRDREGKYLGTAGAPGDYRSVRISPDGRRAATTIGKWGQVPHVWLQDLSRGTNSRAALGSASESDPVWSPDGSRIIFSSNRDGPFDLYQVPATGASDAAVVLRSEDDKSAASWSRDGRFMLYIVQHPKTKADIWVLPLTGGRKPFPFMTTEFNERFARFSPDGHWVAYTSDESGHDEVYVRSFSTNAAGIAAQPGTIWRISEGYGTEPTWRDDSRELYYRSRYKFGLMAVDFANQPAFGFEKPRPLGVVFPSQSDPDWDSAGDGKRFLISEPKSAPEPYTVILNWQAGLKK